MNRKWYLVPFIFFALVGLACSVTFNLPNVQSVTGNTISETISLPLPVDKNTPSNVTFQFGAGSLILQPGATEGLVTGTVKYNVSELKPVVTSSNNNVTISQGKLNLNIVPAFISKVINEWSFMLADYPMNLTINAGAYNGSYELGGLSITRLEVTDGAAKVDLGFSSPNMVEMSSLTYSTGASDVAITGLGNANVSDVAFNGGAGSYVLDFSGQLQRDMTVSVDSGISSVTIRVPPDVSAQVTSNSSLISVTTSGSWLQQGTTYQQSGSGNRIIILVRMGAGSLQLENSH
jgi:hypothetical protein